MALPPAGRRGAGWESLQYHVQCSMFAFTWFRLRRAE